MDVAIMDLRGPADDEAIGRLTCTARILAAHDETGLDHVADRIGDAEQPAAVDQASLFIDGCADDARRCRAMPDAEPECGRTGFDGLPPGRCRNWGSGGCDECRDGEHAAPRQPRAPRVRAQRRFARVPLEADRLRRATGGPTARRRGRWPQPFRVCFTYGARFHQFFM